nr:hypothetical protein [bacterium]
MEYPAVLHIDGDDFFAELARQKNRRLGGRPVIVGHLHSRGAVVAASYEARHAGIVPGMTMQQAQRRCPDAAAVQIDWERVRKASDTLVRHLHRYSPQVEQIGADAAYLDYTGCTRLFGPAPDFSIRLQQEIYDDLKITVSAGLASDKAVSAVACRSAKLGTMQCVPAGEEAVFMADCPLIWLPGIDPRLSEFFNFRGIRSIGELAQLPLDLLEHVLGARGRVLGLRARARERARVRGFEPQVREDHSEDFSGDQIRPERILVRVAGLASHLGFSLRTQRMSARILSMDLRYTDGRHIRGQSPVHPPSNRDPELFRVARDLFTRLYVRRVRVRGISLNAPRLIHCPAELPFGESIRRVKWDRVM